MNTSTAMEDDLEDIYPETETLACLANSSKHQYLLKHPVLVLFLMIKWKHLNFAYTANLLFYLTFVAFITAYIYFVYDDETALVCDNGIHIYSPPVERLWYIVTILLTMLMMREGYQLSFSFTKYILAVVNWLEIILISLSSIMLFHKPNECNLEKKRIVAASLILVSWSVLYTMLLRHPKFTFLNVYFTMFAKVGWTFIKFLFCYGIFIIAFGIGFHILLNNKPNTEKATDVNDNYTHLHNNGNETKFPYYNKIGSSLFITFSMLVGELYISDSPENTPYGYLTFVTSFVFIIVMVMMNLLNGLAVRDIREIKNKSKIYAYKTQIETLATYEAMLLGDPFMYLSRGRISKTSFGYLSFLNSFRWFRAIDKFVDTFFGKFKQRRFAPFVRKQIQKIPFTRNNLLFSHNKKYGMDYSVILYPNVYKMHLAKNGNTRVVYVPPELSLAAKEIALKHQLKNQLKPKNLDESLNEIEAAIVNNGITVEKKLSDYQKKLMEIEARLMTALKETKINNEKRKIENQLDQRNETSSKTDTNVQEETQPIPEPYQEEQINDSDDFTNL